MEWVRDETSWETDRWGLFEYVLPQIKLRTERAAGRVRIGLWRRSTRVAGWFVPHLPADSILTIDGTTAIGIANGERRVLHNFLRGWDSDFPSRVPLPHGVYRLTIDQDPERVVDVYVGVTLTGMSE